VTESSIVLRRLTTPAVVLLLPALVLWVTPTLLLQATWLDPYVYGAYIHDYRQTFLRFGVTYYSNRIAAIDLTRLVLLFIHSDASYYVVRYILLIVASASIFAIARRFYGAAVAAVSAVLLCFSPWYVRALANDYVDGFAITYLFAGLAWLLVPKRRVIAGHVAAGMCFALAVNSNLYTLAFGGCFAPAWYVLRGRNTALRLRQMIVAVLVGFVAMYVIMGVSLRVEFPNRSLFFEHETLRMAAVELRGGGDQYFVPIRGILFDVREFYVLVPVVLCITSLIVVARVLRGGAAASREFLIAATVYLTTITALYLFGHFALHHGIIYYPYYFSYALIATHLVLVALIGEAAAASNRRGASIVLAAGATVYFVEYVLYSLPLSERSWPLWLWVATTIILPLCCLLKLRPLSRLSVIVVCVMAIPIPFYNSGLDYRFLHSRVKYVEEWDVYRGARYLQETIGRVIDPNDMVRFWYDQSDTRTNLDSIQSMYLWGYSDVPTNPRVDDRFLAKIADARYLVLLGMNSQQIDKRIAALSSASIPFSVIRRDRFTGVVWSFQFTTLELIRRHDKTS
jgi:hypothetical protein